MLNDADQRVVPFALASLTKLKAPNAATILLERLKADDPVVRAAAATGLGDLKPPAGAQALEDAYRFGVRDSTYVARAAALAGPRQVRRRGRDAGASKRVRRQGLGGPHTAPRCC
jgi:HEAT repeat protein